MISKINTKGREGKNAVIAGAITIFIVGLLIASGPASAFELSVSVADGENHNFTLGQDVELNAEFDINNNDANLPIEKLGLFIDGPGANDYTCYFNVDGSKISGCDGITITLINTNVNYGYGYGYGYESGDYYDFGYGYGYGNGAGSLSYKIVIDTDNYHLGSYKANLFSDINGQRFESDSSHFVVSEKKIKEDNTEGNSNGGCLTAWTCSDWNACNAGTQTRISTKEKSYCYVDPKLKPAEKQTCSTGNTNNQNTNSNTNSGNENSQTLTTDTNTNTANSRGFLSRVTGAVVGDGSGLGAGIFYAMVFIISVMVLSLVVYMVRNRRRKRIYY